MAKTHDNEVPLWRSLDELARSPEFLRWTEAEFPEQVRAGGLGRREFLKMAAVSFALAGLGGCGERPPRQIVPYVHPQPAVVPGEAVYFATSVLHAGYALGVVVDSRLGRPTKIEGNPEHPASLGATDIFAQAQIYELYDPDRSQAVYRGGRISAWSQFEPEWRAVLADMRGRGGAGLRLLTGRITSPTALAHISQLLEELPEARWHVYEPIDDTNAQEGLKTAFGQPADLVYSLERADVIFSLDCDFLNDVPGSVRYAREFGRRRTVRQDGINMCRLYVAEPSPTVTGSIADNRLPVRPGLLPAVLGRLAERLGVSEGELSATRGAAALDENVRHWVDVLARDLEQHRGASLVCVGRRLPPQAHALAALCNERLGNVGATLRAIEPVPAPTPAFGGLSDLLKEMQAGAVTHLLIFGANPVYTAPADFAFADELARVPWTAHFGLYRDETAVRCFWHLPLSHTLESWSDARAFDGTAGIIQPLLTPLYQTRSLQAVLAMLAGRPLVGDRELVRDHWRKTVNEADFESWWREVLRAGVIPNSAAPGLDVEVRADAVRQAWRSAAEPREDRPNQLELAFAPDPTLWDGAYASNVWLQESPKPITKLSWNNAALVAPQTAERLGLRSRDVVQLTTDNRAVLAAVLPVPGHAPDCLTLPLGYGREVAAAPAATGFNAYALRTSSHPWLTAGAVERTATRQPLISTQMHFALEGRPLLRRATVSELTSAPAIEHSQPRDSLYPEWPYPGTQWAMVIDLTRCNGCSACTIACQAENNIPTVGPDQVQRGREMYWMLVHTYFSGSPDAPGIYHQPRPCMHCEKAPCELVCPVGATQHSADGLNEMIYNRCVGTRYCSNNCPYKVRRFNFYNYTRDDPPVQWLQRNPEVTVRARGVMEKCTYCVQRIRAAEIEARIAERPIPAGRVVPACAAACPTQAIFFGDMNDPESPVAPLKREATNFDMLAELNTRPRTSYLAAIRDPNPELT